MSPSTEKQQEPIAEPVVSGWLISLVLGATFGLWLVALAVAIFSGHSWERLGQIGDSFGAINALFSGLGFAGLVITLLLQGKQMRTQQIDVQRQLDEMKAARSAQLQPFVAVSPDKNLLLNHPRHFLARPQGDEVGTRFSVRSKLTNASRDPAINVRVNAVLSATSAADIAFEDSIPLPIMPTDQADFEVEFFIGYKTIIDNIESIIAPIGTSAREIAAGKSCFTLKYHIAFENTLGSSFEVHQLFSLHVIDDGEVLRGWVTEWNKSKGITAPPSDAVQAVRVSAFALPGTRATQTYRS